MSPVGSEAGFYVAGQADCRACPLGAPFVPSPSVLLPFQQLVNFTLYVKSLFA